MLAFRRAERRLAMKHDHPFLVEVVRVVGPQLVARRDLGHRCADQFTADPLPDERGPDAPPVAVSRPVPLVVLEVESVHQRTVTNSSSSAVYGRRRSATGG